MTRSEAMRFGAMFTLQRSQGESLDHATIYRTTLEQAELAEALGYDWINVGEHHISADGFLPAALSLLSAVAARTERIGLSTGMLVSPLYHPLQLAEQAAVVDLISGGRLALGVAAGYRRAEFDALEIDFSTRGLRFRESLEILVQAWSGRSFAYDGSAFSFPEVVVRPTPVQRPHPRLWLGGTSDAALRRAAGWGSPCFPGGTTTLPEIERMYARYRDFAAEADGEDHGLVLQRFCLVADTVEEARRRASPCLEAVLRQYREWGRALDVEALLSDWDRLESIVIVGDEERCAELLARHQAAGATDVMLQFALPLLDSTVAAESMRRLAPMTGDRTARRERSGP